MRFPSNLHFLRFGSSHSVQMASSTPGSPNGSGGTPGLPPKPKGLPPLGAPKGRRCCQRVCNVERDLSVVVVVVA